MVLLINDSELKYEKMLEDINSLLNTGEIPSLFQGEEKEVILSELKEIVQKNEK
jgi:dynein heavy chain